MTDVDAALRGLGIVYFGNDWNAENRTSSHHVASRLAQRIFIFKLGPVINTGQQVAQLNIALLQFTTDPADMIGFKPQQEKNQPGRDKNEEGALNGLQHMLVGGGKETALDNDIRQHDPHQTEGQIKDSHTARRRTALP